MYKKQLGFIGTLVVILIVIIAAIVMAFVLVNRNNIQQSSGDNNGDSRQIDNNDLPEPVLYNFGLESLSSIDVTEDALREYDESGRKGFYIFGASLLKNDPRINPNFEFASVKAGTNIISAIDGIVIEVKEQGSDVEIITMLKENSSWTVGYDHVAGSAIHKGDKVSVGQVLGQVAPENSGRYRFEFQINGEAMMYCPTDYLHESVKAKYTQELIDMMKRWNAIKPGLYDLDSYISPGCAKTSLTVDEAEGN